MLNNILEEQVLKAAVKDIDIEALAKKFKPQIEKKLEEGLGKFIKEYDIAEAFWNGKGSDIMDDFINKSIINLVNSLTKSKGK